MTQLNAWFKANKLTLNSGKSNFIVFRSNKNPTTNLPEKIYFENTSINRSGTSKYLGVTLDEHVNGINIFLKYATSLKDTLNYFIA